VGRLPPIAPFRYFRYRLSLPTMPLPDCLPHGQDDVFFFQQTAQTQGLWSSFLTKWHCAVKNPFFDQFYNIIFENYFRSAIFIMEFANNLS
jgi:hypothetical protein